MQLPPIRDHAPTGSCWNLAIHATMCSPTAAMAHSGVSVRIQRLIPSTTSPVCIPHRMGAVPRRARVIHHVGDITVASLLTSTHSHSIVTRIDALMACPLAFGADLVSQTITIKVSLVICNVFVAGSLPHSYHHAVPTSNVVQMTAILSGLPYSVQIVCYLDPSTVVFPRSQALAASRFCHNLHVDTHAWHRAC